MRETIDFRIPENDARQHLEPSVGVILGDSVRKVVVATDNPLFQHICEIDRDFQQRTNGHHFYVAWIPHRRYTKTELDAADAFRVQIKRTFEPAGEQCGTLYDESTTCPQCGAGATQVSELCLDLRKAPRGVDIAVTIADEVIISQRLAERITDGGFKGFELRRVRHKARYEDDPLDLHEIPSGREILQHGESAGAPHPTGAFWVWLNRSDNRRLLEKARQEHAALKRRTSGRRAGCAPVWHQLVPTSTVEILAPTRTGISPSDYDLKGVFRCPRGHTIGLNLISELWVSRQDFNNCDCDIAYTKQCLGVRRGLLRPSPMLLISARVWRALNEGGLKGFGVEIAHLT